MSKEKQVSTFSSAVAADSLRLDSLQSNTIPAAALRIYLSAHSTKRSSRNNTPRNVGDYHLKTFEAWSPSALLILSALNLLDLYRAA